MMPTERAMNVAIFLDDVNEYNGPLMFIPGSHKKGVVDAKHDLTTTSYPLWTVDNDLIAQLVERAGGKNGGIVSPKGPAGSMILFHSCLVHASGSNLSPWNRVSVYLSLCAVSNHIRRFKRPEYIAHRDFAPIELLPDDCLLKPLPGGSAVEGRHAGQRAAHVGRAVQRDPAGRLTGARRQACALKPGWRRGGATGAAPARNDANVGAGSTSAGSARTGCGSGVRDACHSRQTLIGSSSACSTSTGGSHATSA